MIRVMGIDAGFAAMGLVVVEGNRVVHYDTFRTQRTATKRGIRVADDDAERAQVLTQFLADAINEWEPAGAVVELPSGGAQGARANRSMGMATGLVVAVLEVMRVPAEWVTPHMVKMATAGRKDASKAMVQEAVRERFEWTSWPGYKWQEEHMADAAGAVLAAEGGTLMRMIERMGSTA